MSFLASKEKTSPFEEPVWRFWILILSAESLASTIIFLSAIRDNFATLLELAGTLMSLLTVMSPDPFCCSETVRLLGALPVESCVEIVTLVPTWSRSTISFANVASIITSTGSNKNLPPSPRFTLILSPKSNVFPETSANPPRSPVAKILPNISVWLSDQTTTSPPSPTPLAEASIKAVSKMLTFNALGALEPPWSVPPISMRPPPSSFEDKISPETLIFPPSLWSFEEFLLSICPPW